MKHYILSIIFILHTTLCSAQVANHKIDPALKTMMDTAAARFTRTGGEPAKVREIIAYIDGIIKKDNLYFDAWINKLTLQCQLSQFDAGLQTTRAMNKVFPNETDALFLGGVMEYYTGHKAEAKVLFTKLLNKDNGILKGHENDPKYKGVAINKGIVLILLDRRDEGKALLHKVYDKEKDPYVQSYIGFYIQSSKEEIIADRVPRG